MGDFRKKLPKALFIASLCFHVTDSVLVYLYTPPAQHGGTLVNMIIETLETIKFGEFVKFENMEMVPLLAERAAD